MVKLVSCLVSCIKIEFILFVVFIINIEVGLLFLDFLICKWLNNNFYVVILVKGRVVVLLLLRFVGVRLIMCLLISCSLVLLFWCVKLLV